MILNAWLPHQKLIVDLFRYSSQNIDQSRKKLFLFFSFLKRLFEKKWGKSMSIFTIVERFDYVCVMTMIDFPRMINDRFFFSKMINDRFFFSEWFLIDFFSQFKMINSFSKWTMIDFFFLNDQWSNFFSKWSTIDFSKWSMIDFFFQIQNDRFFS